METHIELYEELFARDRRLLVQRGRIAVHGFRYPSGVAALDVDTGAARFVLLPFQGQQIWDAWSGKRQLTMQSVFDMPVATRAFRRTYGGFFLHCGATAMGNPTQDDPHLPHGELPNLPFGQASLVVGDDADGRGYIELTGTAYDREAFSHAYAFRPRLRFTAGASDVEATIVVENIGGSAMPFMYLGHVNFRPVAGSVIRDAMASDAWLKWSKPDLAQDAPASVHAWHYGVVSDPGRHRAIRPHDRVEPEFVATVRLPADASGWAHALQVLPDGDADFVSYRPADLPYCVRWITRAPERQAVGFALPATAGPEGRTAARNADTLLYLAPGETFSTEIRFGTLTSEQAAALLSTVSLGASTD